MAGPFVLCLNAGSSSLKFKLYGVGSLTQLCSGLCERIGDALGNFPNFHATVSSPASSPASSPTAVPAVDERIELRDHAAALRRVVRFLTGDLAIHPSDVVAVGHRVVMGGRRDAAVVVDERVKKEIEEGALLAPLHNPANLLGIQAAEQAFPSARQVAVFDTAFHTSIPARNRTYALPKSLNEKWGLAKYGFHGTSYRYLANRVALQLGKAVDDCNLILMHLGAGASICAVKGGRSIDTSMGLSPTAGLVMATRSGDVDPSIVAFLVGKERMSADEVERILNGQSGLLGLCGKKDLRDVHEAARQGDGDAELAIDVFVSRIRHFLASYFFQLEGRVDAIVFSAGVGEHDGEVRRRVLEGMGWAGVELDVDLNEKASGLARIDTGAGSARATRRSAPKRTTAQVWVIPTDEELGIAEEVKMILQA
jgi:acetate kinase